MGRPGLSPEELWKKAKANGYEYGVHHAEDSIRDKFHYSRKTLRDQDVTLERYEKYIHLSLPIAPEPVR